MVHDSYGILKPTNIYMKKNYTCKNQYFKEFASNTTIEMME